LSNRISEDYLSQTQPYLEGIVTNGAEWLDATLPNWWTHIDLNAFDMQSTETCVLGQLRRHGFVIKVDHSALRWCFFGGGRLTKLWVQAIERRNAPSNPPSSDSGTDAEGLQVTPHSKEDPARLPSIRHRADNQEWLEGQDNWKAAGIE
jgi:hypothetical protein